MTARAASLQNDDAALARAHPLTLFGFDALVAGAARPRPGALAFRDVRDDVTDQVTYADLYQRVGACLSRLRDLRIARGERIIVCSPPGAQGFVALTAALAAGLDPVLAPLPLPYARDAVARAAKTLQAAAIFAPAQFCGIDFEGPLLDLAACTPSIRLIAALDGALDGAVDFSPATLQAPHSPRVKLSDEWSGEESARVGALNDRGEVDFASQGSLLGVALDLVRLTRQAGEAPILSLCALSSLGALVAGPLAALLAGAPLHSLAPFTAERFLNSLDSLGPARLVAPASVLGDLSRAGLLTNGALLGVAALCTDAAAVIEVEAACPIVALRFSDGMLTLRDATYAPAHVEMNAAAL